MKKSKEKFYPLDELMNESLIDKEVAAGFLSLSLKNDEDEDFRRCLHRVINAYGGVGSFAEEFEVSRQKIYHSLNGTTALKLSLVKEIIKKAGLELQVVAVA